MPARMQREETETAASLGMTVGEFRAKYAPWRLNPQRAAKSTNGKRAKGSAKVGPTKRLAVYERAGVLDLRLHRRGITRTVLLIGPWAIKWPSFRGLGAQEKGMRIASFCRGVLANQSELEWSEVEGINPVVWTWRCIVNVYRRAQPVVVDEETFDFDALCPDWTPIGDRKSENLGVVNDRIVWIDYDFSWNGVRVHARSEPTSVYGSDE